MFFTRRAGHKFVDRGDPDSADFGIGDLTANSAWHTLDLSAIIPKNAKLIVLRIDAKENEGLKIFQFKKNGKLYNFTAFIDYTVYPDVDLYCKLVVAPDNAGVIEYYITTATWATFNITVAGWFV